MATIPVFSLDSLKDEVKNAVCESLAENTKKSYNSNLRNFSRFCITHAVSPVLVVSAHSAYDTDEEVESAFTYFFAWCCRTMVVDSADKNCTAVATWTLHQFGHRPKYRSDLWKTAARGLRRLLFKIPSRKLPVLSEHIEKIADWIDADDFDSFNVYAAFTVPFHALLRKSEFTMRSQRLGFRPEVDLCWGKVHFSPDPFNPVSIELDLGICKGDQFKPTRVYLYLARNEKICPVRALQRLYWWSGAARSADDPVFVYKGEPFTPSKFTRVFHNVMATACKVSDRVPHSLRVGGAQALQDAGAPPWCVQAIGRWRSEAYRLYCHENFRAVLRWARDMGDWRAYRRGWR